MFVFKLLSFVLFYVWQIGLFHILVCLCIITLYVLGVWLCACAHVHQSEVTKLMKCTEMNNLHTRGGGGLC